MSDEKKERINFVSEKLAALAQAEIARADRLVEAREEGRIAGLREAAKLLDDNWYKTQADCIEAITRAAEGK